MTSDKIYPGPDPDLLCIPLCSISRGGYCTNHFTIFTENLLCAEHWGQELLPAEVSPQEWKDFLEQWQRSHQEYGGESGRMWSRKWKCSEAWWNSGLAKMRHKAGRTGLASSRPLAKVLILQPPWFDGLGQPRYNNEAKTHTKTYHQSQGEQEHWTRSQKAWVQAVTLAFKNLRNIPPGIKRAKKQWCAYLIWLLWGSCSTVMIKGLTENKCIWYKFLTWQVGKFFLRKICVQLNLEPIRAP